MKKKSGLSTKDKDCKCYVVLFLSEFNQLRARPSNCNKLKYTDVFFMFFIQSIKIKMVHLTKDVHQYKEMFQLDHLNLF